MLVGANQKSVRIRYRNPLDYCVVRSVLPVLFLSVYYAVAAHQSDVSIRSNK